MPKPRPDRPLDRWQVLRATGIVVLLALLIFRVFVRQSPSAPLHTPVTEIRPQAAIPPEVRDRLDAVGWPKHVGDGLGLWVSVSWQRIIGIQGGVVQCIYPCSTASRGAGNREGSNKTPLGWHEIAERMGAGLPQGAVFTERKYAGRVWTKDQPTEKDFVLTRILWLRGVERGINLGPGVDSHDRYIYIHGTPDEDKIGKPASLGCVRMLNRDVIELFDRTTQGMPVLITEW